VTTTPHISIDRCLPPGALAQVCAMRRALFRSLNLPRRRLVSASITSYSSYSFIGPFCNKNGDHYADPLPAAHVAFLMTGNHNNRKNRYNNCSGDKQSNSQSVISLTATPHNEAHHQ